MSSRGWGFCLDDRPSKRDLTTPLARLGVRYTTHHQCQLQYGPNATFCHEVDVSAASSSRCSLKVQSESPEPRTPGLTGSSSSLRTSARSSGVQSTAPAAPSWMHPSTAPAAGQRRWVLLTRRPGPQLCSLPDSSDSQWTRTLFQSRRTWSMKHCWKALFSLLCVSGASRESV